MVDKDEALKLALEALESLQGGCIDSDDGTVEAITVWCPEVIDAIREALAQPEQEPHGWYIDGYGAVIGTEEPKSVRVGEWLPWYITSPQRKPLTNEQKAVPWATREDYYRELNRSVEHIRKEMEIKSVTMRCKDYDLALPIINTRFGRVLVGQVFAPPQPKPLTDEQLIAAYESEQQGRYGDHIRSLRAIEAAHGIKGE